MSEPAGPTVVAVDEQHDVKVDVARWSGLATAALRAEGVAAGELNLIFVDEGEMHALNRSHLGEDRPTDVLSFPLDGSAEAPVGEPLIGDVVVCPSYAARQAPEHAGTKGHSGSLDDELALLVVHGVLHVLGWDHVDDNETRAMQARETLLLDAFHR